MVTIVFKDNNDSCIRVFRVKPTDQRVLDEFLVGRYSLAIVLQKISYRAT